VILEAIVTSVDDRARVNIAPMGPRVVGDWSGASCDDITFVLRPFNSSRTYRNLIETRKAVVHVTDDSELFAKAAVDAIESDEVEKLVQQIDASLWWRLRDCHRWFALEVESISRQVPRVDMQCRVVQMGIVRPFFGFNRGKHAVIEAAILATRTHVLPPDEIRDEIDRLTPLIDKTGGSAEHSAFEFLRKTIDDRLASR
jgi:hypothetical protein